MGRNLGSITSRLLKAACSRARAGARARALALAGEFGSLLEVQAEPMLRVRETTGGVIVEVRVAPRSTRERVLGVHDGALKVSLTAPPVEGAANAALVTFLSRLLNVPKSAVRILRGERSKRKTVEIQGVDSTAVLSLLEAS